MTELLVRDVPQEIADALAERAKRHGRSAEDEHRFILEDALRAAKSDFWERAAEFRRETKGRIKTESWKLIREDRDNR